MTELLENALRKVATLPQEEQDAIASQILETLEDETAWKPADLARWLDRQAHQPDVSQPVFLEYCRRVVTHLVEDRGMSLASLTGTNSVSQNSISGIQCNGSLLTPIGIIASASTGVTMSQNTLDGIVGGFSLTGTGDVYGIALSTGFINPKAH